MEVRNGELSCGGYQVEILHITERALQGLEPFQDGSVGPPGRLSPYRGEWLGLGNGTPLHLEIHLGIAIGRVDAGSVNRETLEQKAFRAWLGWRGCPSEISTSNRPETQ